MSGIDLHRAPRPLRWYEWLGVLALAGYAAGAHAVEVYKCTDAQGAVTYQDRACESASAASAVALPPMPAYAPSPEYAVERDAPSRAASRAQGAKNARGEPRTSSEHSYECRTSDGQVFYRHSSCPHSVAAVDKQISSRSRGAAAKSVAVTQVRVSREEACYELRRAGAAGRSGRGHDQDVSTYDKNLGRDPCR
jgi:hypothetical protein